MRSFFFRILLALAIALPVQAQEDPKPNPITIEFVRMLSKDIFDLNSVPYLEPMVVSMNATSNSRFFHSAYIPTSVEKPYFRFGVHSMVGFIRDDQKTYTPQIPVGDEPMVDIASLNPNDTAQITRLTYQLIKSIFKDEIARGAMKPPKTSPTIFGKETGAVFEIPRDTLKSDIMKNPYYQVIKLLSPNSTTAIISAVESLPKEVSLPSGADMSTLIAAVPQLEIGSWHGTELLLRFIPPVRFNENVGDFAFWGIGLKHSISQYFPQAGFDLAMQAVYQGTSLKNTIGLTNAELKSEATIWNVNINGSREWQTGKKSKLGVFSGLSAERLDIHASYKYYLGIGLQRNLFMISAEEARNNISRDDKPQTSTVDIGNTNVKFTLGTSFQYDRFSIFLDYSVSKFNLFSMGLSVTF